VVLHGGVVEQVGAPMDLYNHPANAFVAGFIGSPKMNMFSLDVARGAGWLQHQPEASKTFGVRPEHMVRGDTGLEGRVYHVEHLGGQTLTHLKLESGHDFVLSEPGAGDDNAGDLIHLNPAEGCLHIFDVDGRALR
ncbi:MAG: TOBE domain-containing protein, partial [Pseudomonadota bacterium]